MSGAERVLVLMGGPDTERGVSIASGEAVAAALERRGFAVRSEVIDRPSGAALRSLVEGAFGGVVSGGVVFPALHGPFGEGGALQRMLERVGAVFVGTGSAGSRLAIDKAATKRAAGELRAGSGGFGGIGVSETWTVDAAVDGGPEGVGEPPVLPVVVKPNFEGSTVGVRLCGDAAAWRDAVSEATGEGRATIAERLVDGVELTVGVLEREGALVALPMVAIEPAGGVYDFAAKYERDDTGYRFGVRLPGVEEREVERFAVSLCERVGVRHLARADFIFEAGSGLCWFLELNTMPGFTGHSLVPMAAAEVGIGFDELCEGLVHAAASGSGAGVGNAGVAARRG